MKGLSDKDRMLQFDKLGLDQMGSLGLSSLMQDIPALQKAMDATTNSAGAMEKAYKDSLTPFESWSILQNKVKVGMIKIGEIFLPIASAIGDKILEIVEYWQNLYKESQGFRDLLSGIGTVVKWLWDISWMGFDLIINLIKGIYDITSTVINKIGEWITKTTGVKTSFTNMYDSIRPYLIWVKEMLESIGSLLYDVFTLNLDSAYEKIKNFKVPELDEIRQRVRVEVTDDDGDFSGVPTGNSPTTGGLLPDNGASTIADGARSIKGGSQTKNITINIESFIKGFNPTHQSFNGLSDSEFERKMTEIFMRVIRSAETSF